MGSPTLNELCEAYLNDRRNPDVDRPCKHPRNLESVLKASRALWGDMKLKHFADGSRQRVKDAVIAWRAAGKNDHTIRKHISVLKTVFRFAIANEIIKRGAEPIIDLPRAGLPRERFLTEDELARLLKAADHPDTLDHTLLLLEILVRTGVRLGAAMALRWEHVDFDKRVIRFRDTEAAGERSKKRRGNKPMDDDLIAIMQRAFEARTCEHVIAWRGARVKNPRVGLKALFKRAGLENVRIHDLRRSSATYVYTETDGDLKAAATHIVDTEATTRKHYAQDDPRVHLPGISAVSNVMARARSNGAAH